jgi:hypothetical protein
MTHIELKPLLEERLTRAKDKLTEARDDIEVRISITYMNDALEEYDTYKDRTTLIIGNLFVCEKDGDPTVHPCFTILSDLRGGIVINPAETEKEFVNFERDIDGLSERIKDAEDVGEFLEDEMLAIEKEGEALVKEMEKTVNKHKKIAIIGAVCLGVIMVAVLIAKIIL